MKEKIKGRNTIRLHDFDYSQAGGYFVTICTHERKCLFGEIIRGNMVLNEFGKIAKTCWEEISRHFSFVEMDEFVVMPNHIHGIILLEPFPPKPAFRRDTACRVPTGGECLGSPAVGSLSTIIRSYKSAVTKAVNEFRRTPSQRFWQGRFYEHVVRNDKDLDSIREYIVNNPLQWHLDEENPSLVQSLD